MIDVCIFVYSSNGVDSYKCIEKIKMEIEKEKTKEKSREIINYIAIDYAFIISIYFVYLIILIEKSV